MSSSSNLSDYSPCPRVVIDLGNSLIKAGFAGDDSPAVIVPNLIGTPKQYNELVMIGAGEKDYYLGKEALEKKGNLTLRYPIQRGVVQDWEALEKILRYVYKELKVLPSQSGVLITESPLNPKNNSEKLCELFFETFDVPFFIIATDCVLSLSSAGMWTGMVLSSGGGVTSVLPMYEGCVIKHAVRRANLGGCDVTNYLCKLLLESGYSFRTSAEREIARHLKESMAYVVQDFNHQMVNYWSVWDIDMEKTYKLPDESIITVSTELFECTECLFQPSHLGRDHKGIQSLIHSSIEACDIDLRRDLFNKILLSGGNTMFPGMPKRLHKELVNMSPPKSLIKVLSLPNRNNLTWIGGSIFASGSFFNPWIERLEYDEIGPNMVHIKYI